MASTDRFIATIEQRVTELEKKAPPSQTEQASAFDRLATEIDEVELRNDAEHKNILDRLAGVDSRLDAVTRSIEKLLQELAITGGKAAVAATKPTGK